MTRAKQGTARVSKPNPKPRSAKPKASPLQASTTTPAPLAPDSPAPRPRLRARTPTHCTVGHQYYERHDNQVAGHAVPKLRLSGRWLERCGFTIGDVLQVTVGQGVLLIGRGRRD